MYTELGKFLRHLRIDINENLREMSERLGVSSAFLSSIENGKKNISSKIRSRLISEYSLTKSQILKLDEAITLSMDSISINIENVPLEKQKFGVLFARSFEKMDDEQMKKIQDIIKRRS